MARDEEVESPKGVGESINRRGEDVVKQEGKEPGRYETGAKDDTGRPAGKSTLRDQTSVDPKKLLGEDDETADGNEEK